MDDAAFDAFYDRTAPDVARYVYLLTASPHRAVHATQRAYARVYAEWEIAAHQSNIDSWVRMKASDIALDHLHRAQHKVSGWLHLDRIARKVLREPPGPEEESGSPDAPTDPGTGAENDGNKADKRAAPGPADATDSTTNAADTADTAGTAGTSSNAGTSGRTGTTAAADATGAIRATAATGRAGAAANPDEPATSSSADRTPPADGTAPGTSPAQGSAEGDASAPRVPCLDPQPKRPGAAPDTPDDDGDGGDGDGQWATDVALLRALRGIPVHRRRAVVLCHHYGMTPEEVAIETESTLGSTIERIAFANRQLTHGIEELAEADPDGPEAHKRIAAIMRDLAARYRPELQAAGTLRADTQARGRILVGAVATALVGLAAYAAVAMAVPGSLPDERAEVRASISAREAAGLPLVAHAPKPPIKIGRSTARAEDVPADRRELVRVKGTASHDGGTFLIVDTADGPADAPQRKPREIPLSPKVSFHGAKAFGLSKQQVVYAGDFLSKAAEGALATAVFEVQYDEDDQVALIRERTSD
ncbi:hypothetical protein [Yinghuangia sp. YIM S10712]|uniref:RNA polymerase sigma factor n=1 Tax=Yinghuangia sp. YIM S10712 TaxID=3436930 RepID=UPI003F531D2D